MPLHRSVPTPPPAPGAAPLAPHPCFQVFVAGRLVGGAAELLPLLEDGSLQAQLAGAPDEPLPPEVVRAVEQAFAAVRAFWALPVATAAAGSNCALLRGSAGWLAGGGRLRRLCALLWPEVCQRAASRAAGRTRTCPYHTTRTPLTGWSAG